MKRKTVLVLMVVLSLSIPAAVSQNNTIKPPGTVEITYPPDGSVINGTITIEVSTTGCIDMVEFYIDGVLKYTDTIAPFSYTWYSTDQTPGKHIIMVKGYCSGVFQDDDKITVKVKG